MKIQFLPLFYLVFCVIDYSMTQITNTATIDTSGGVKIENITIGGYADVYYGYNFNQSPDHVIPYMSCSNRQNEFNVNLVYVDLRYSHELLRARIVPAFGTLINANYASEQGTIKSILEASAGIKIAKTKNYWLELGIFGSPFTSESFISKDHYMYTRSLAAENVPYYLAGIKSSFKINPKLTINGFIVNGWQQIQDQNNGKSIVTQVEYQASNKQLLNWNTYVGDERSSEHPDYRMRIFSDFYWFYNPIPSLQFITSIYGGLQHKKTVMNTSRDYWCQFNITSKYNLSPKSSISARLEYFSDPKSTILFHTDGIKPTALYGSGLCFNYSLNKHAVVRLDARYLSSPGIMDIRLGNFVTNSFQLMSNMTIWF